MHRGVWVKGRVVYIKSYVVSVILCYCIYCIILYLVPLDVLTYGVMGHLGCPSS